MDQSVHSKLISFIWSIADDCLRDIYVRGKYRDVILPMTVLRRLDTLLEPTKEDVLEELEFQKIQMCEVDLDDEPLKRASRYVFYNTSKWTLKSLYNSATNNKQLLLAHFEEYLHGFSSNVQEIISCFKLHEQVRHMAAKEVLLDVVEKFISPYINLTPESAIDPEGGKLPALSNLGMGYVFEELIRKFNEENNEEAGEHFTPREVIELMTHLVFDPIKDSIPLTITIYDPACGSGGMLTEAQNFIEEKYPHAKRDIFLYGKEINDETYAICKSDMMIKGNDPSNIKSGSTLSTDEFASARFDYMLSNPPYGKSWAAEQKHIKDGSEVIDPRFRIRLSNYWGEDELVDATPRSSDGQLLFLMEMVSKMKSTTDSPQGSRIASVHNGSALFTGDAAGGESNIRRYIIENDMLEAIIQLPNNMFYNTGISTYVWLVSNAKSAERKGKVQLIDASNLSQKLRKNLGNKNCEFTAEHIAEINDSYLSCQDIEQKVDAQHNAIGIASKIFKNSDFGYYKVTIERPDRRKAQFTSEAIASLRYDKQLAEVMEYIYTNHGDAVYELGFLTTIEKAVVTWCEEQNINLSQKTRKKLFDTDLWQAQRLLMNTAQELMQTMGDATFYDFNLFKAQLDKELKAKRIKPTAAEKKRILDAVSSYDEQAAKVIKKVYKLSAAQLADLLQRLSCDEEQLPDYGYYPTSKKSEYITYESSTDLRDDESIPLSSSIHDYFLQEVKPHVEESWINLESVKIGYEISFNKYFYRHKPLRTLEEVAADILALEEQAEGLIAQILGISK